METLNPLIATDIQQLIQDRRFDSLKSLLKDRHPAEIADLIVSVAEQDKALVFRILPQELASDVFEYLAYDVQETLLKALGKEEVARILNDMSPDDRTALLEELPGQAVKQMLALLSPEERQVAIRLLGYPEGSVGRLMTPDYIAIRSDWTVNEVLNYIRANGQDRESLNVVYVTDAYGKLIDDIRIREFLLAPLDRQVTDMMDSNFVALRANDQQETAVELLKKYDRVALPVVNHAGYLLGIVTVDDAIDVVEESSTEDIQKFGGLDALEASYMSTPLREMIQKRAGWLVILFIGEMLTATALGYFEHEISRAVVLALFIPLIISSGGNSGSQAATLTIRSMALNEITLKDWWKVFRRELFSGLVLGTILGFIGFARISIWSQFSNVYGPHWILIALTVFFSLIGVVLWGTLSGSMLPFLLRRLGIDPATSSAPFVATMVDVTGLIIYFSVAALILKGTLL